MINWFFKKRGPFGALPSAVATAPVKAKPAPSPPPPRVTAPKPVAPPAPSVDWLARLQAAAGDDSALLQLAQEATVLDVKLAAVAALSAETALKQAERAFRSHDRKVHRLAKQRLEAAITQRESRAQAQVLLQRTQGLLEEALPAVNHVVELDREWQALPADALEPAQREQFAALRARLDRQMQARADADQALRQWSAAARVLLAGWLPQLRQAAATGTAADAAQLGQRLQAAAAAAPQADAATDLGAALAAALHKTVSVQAWLDALEAQPPEGDGSPAWPAGLQDLDEGLSASLQLRQSQWLALHRPAPPAAPMPSPAVTKKARPPKPPPLSPEQRQALQDLLQRAETARDEGQLGEMQRLLQSFESSLLATGAALPDGLRARQQALWAEQGRLRDWQQWGGTRARDDLIAEAEALARLTLAAAPSPAAAAAAAAATPAPAPPEPAPAAAEAEPDPDVAVEAAAAASAPAAPAKPARPPQGALRLNLQAHAEAIRDLRQRWKALDRTGAVASGEQWQQFDGALQTAHVPVAAQLAAVQATRLENLAAREGLLMALEAQAAGDASAAGGDAAPDWRASIRELDRFNTEWRKLGPVEHTVPRAAQAALQQRVQAALARIEAPLQAARAAAAAERETLIQRAESLAPAAGQAPSPDAARQVRDLQARWQDEARRLPLPRGLETALGSRCKAATDAIFAQREAAVAARDAELAANLAHAQSLLQRLADIGPDTAPDEIERTLSEVDRAWRQGGEVPRGALDGLEARSRKVRDAAAQHIGAAVRQRWQTQCDALAARLAMCETREADPEAATADADLAARWLQLPALPAPWEQALTQRWTGAKPPAAAKEAQVDEWLLRLETALGVPAAPERQAERQVLKLRALKDTLEGRGAVQDGPAQQAAWLQSMLQQRGLDSTRRARLQGLLVALRDAPPGTLGGTGTQR